MLAIDSKHVSKGLQILLKGPYIFKMVNKLIYRQINLPTLFCRHKIVVMYFTEVGAKQ